MKRRNVLKGFMGLIGFGVAGKSIGDIPIKEETIPKMEYIPPTPLPRQRGTTINWDGSLWYSKPWGLNHTKVRKVNGDTVVYRRHIPFGEK